MTKTLSAVAILISALLPGLASGQAVDLAKAVGELTDRLVALSKGDVVGVEGETLYLSLGQKDGILEGTTFEVVRLGEQLKGGMRKETMVGEVAVVRVREQGSIAKVTHKSEEIKEGDQVYQLRKQVARVAVTEFPFDDKFNNLTRNVQDMLYTNLIQKGMSVVEREKLEEVLREQKAGFSGVIDLATAAQVGKLLGVEAMLVGSVADLGDALSVIARLVDVEKGVALTAARASVVKSPTLIDLLGKGTRPIRLGPTEAPPRETVTKAPSGQKRGHSLFEDTFSEDKRDEAWGTAAGNWVVKGGSFTAKPNARAYVTSGSDWEDYAVEVETKYGNPYVDSYGDRRSNSWFGISLRAADDLNRVVLSVYSDKGLCWDVIKEGKRTVDCGGWVEPGPPRQSKIRVEAQGDSFAVYVNGIKRSSLRNGDHKRGMPGLSIVGSWGQGQEPEFSNFKVIELTTSGERVKSRGPQPSR